MIEGGKEASKEELKGDTIENRREWEREGGRERGERNEKIWNWKEGKNKREREQGRGE